MPIQLIIYVSASPTFNTEGGEAVKYSLPKNMKIYGSTNGSVNLLGDWFSVEQLRLGQNLGFEIRLFTASW